MRERLVDGWLTSAGEIGYQAAFAQLLVAEGHRVLHAPVHHPFEHGKDLVSYTPEGRLAGFQLKGGDIGLSDLEKIQPQLFALAGTAVTYPGVEPPRRPDLVTLVTNGRLTAPARDRLRSFNDANRPLGFPPIEVVERDQLVGRFVAAHEAYFPAELADLNAFLQFLLADGRGPFPVRNLFAFLDRLVAPALADGSGLALRRALASAAILTAYVTGPWERQGNHLGVAEGWLALALRTVGVAEERALDEADWAGTVAVAWDSARRALTSLLDEAATAEDLIIPDLAEGLVYPTRAALVCGYLAAFYLSEREAEGRAPEGAVRRVLLREYDYVQVVGEASVPHLLVLATALETLGEATKAVALVTQLATGLAEANRAGKDGGIPDPYHSVEDVLLRTVGGEGALDEETFAGEAHTLHVAVDWLVRRGYRPRVERLWPAVTHVHLCEFVPSNPARLLSHDDPDGQVTTWAPATPASWGGLVADAGRVRETALPARLWQRLGLLPFLPLLLPYRLTANVAKALDYMVSHRCRVEFDDGPLPETVVGTDADMSG